jgi:hypothetical protein
MKFYVPVNTGKSRIGVLTSVMVLLLLFMAIPSCKEEGKDPDDPTDTLTEGEDISVTALVTPCGETLELEDENGTLVRVTFPTVAVSDSTEVTLHLTGEVEDQALENRHIRSFEILPADLILYDAIDISLIFKDKPDNLVRSRLFRVPAEGHLQAFGDLTCSASGDTLSASSVRAGFFTEGDISTDEILRQLEMIFESYGSLSKGAYKVSNAADDIADAWGDMHADIESYYGFIKDLEDYYKDHPEEKEEHQKKICEGVCKGVERILDMPVPEEDPCQRGHIKTIGDIVSAMNRLGCDECAAHEDATRRYNQLIRDCKSYLDTDMDFQGNYDWGTLTQHEKGNIEISARFDDYGMVVVEGTGEMFISGEMEVSDCTGMIVGTSTVFVYGYRDAAFNYTLSLLAEDEGTYYIDCPDGSYQQPFTSTTPTEIVVELNPGNNFLWEEDYPYEGGGTMHVYIQLWNPWVDMTD